MSHFAESRATTALCTADAASITVRGKDFCNEVIGKMGVAAFLYFHVTGREPTEAQAKMLEALIVSITEHGLAPTALAARMTYAAAPEALQGAVAAGILGAGSVLLGSAGEAALLLEQAVGKVKAGEDPRAVARALAQSVRDQGGKLPGFGHPLHKPVDPRSVRLIALARELGVAGRHVDFLEILAEEADAVWGKHLILNIQGPIAAIGLDMGLPAFLTRAIPILARAIGVLGHIAEEKENPIAFYVTVLANEAVTYQAPAG